ncbi:MAG: M20/M25/M40 family metallo-hydrolase [Myxococcaceae bacterium]
MALFFAEPSTLMLGSATLVALALHAAPTLDSGSVAGTLMSQAQESKGAYALLTDLVDQVGPRLSGSKGAEAAVAWAMAQFTAFGLHPRKEPVLVPVWVRGIEEGEVVSAPGRRKQMLALTALGGSPGTPKGGLEADVIEVSSLAQLQERGAAVKGRIVFFNHSMAVASDYGRFGELRTKGPAAAAKLGAVGALVRSLATASIRSPHTGQTQFNKGEVAIPSAAVSTEDAELLHRLTVVGPVRVRLVLGCRLLPEAMSSNVVADLPGREHPEEIVLLGAHLDSWDLAVGAQDDGAGVALVLETARLLSSLKERPRRTVRFVLFMNEENGLRGAKTYASAHAAELAQHVAAMELDEGAGRPIGVALKAGAGASSLVDAWLPPLVSVGAGTLLHQDAGGADLTPMASAQVPLVSVVQDATHYFDIHHSSGDTLDKVDPDAFSRTSAAVTWVTYALAESRAVLPRPEAPAPSGPAAQ